MNRAGDLTPGQLDACAALPDARQVPRLVAEIRRLHAEADELWCPVHGRWAIGNPCEVPQTGQ